MAYIFIYVDVVIAQPNVGPDGNRKIILIVIAIYSSVQMLIKLILAIYHQIKFLLTCKCCQKQL